MLMLFSLCVSLTCVLTVLADKTPPPSITPTGRVIQLTAEFRVRKELSLCISVSYFSDCGLP